MVHCKLQDSQAGVVRAVVNDVNMSRDVTSCMGLVGVFVLFCAMANSLKLYFTFAILANIGEMMCPPSDPP